MRAFVLLLPWVVSLVLLPGTGWAIVEGQTDDFQDGTVMGWVEGPGSPNPPTNVADGGPDGVGDGFLQNVSTGGTGSGSKMTMFNSTTWTGDWLNLAALGVGMQLNNLGDTALDIRIAIQSGSNWFVSQTPFSLAAGSGWQETQFPLSDVARVSGSETLETALANVTQFRILSSTTLDFRGDVIAGTLGVDDITLLTEIPVEETTWGGLKARP